MKNLELVLHCWRRVSTNDIGNKRRNEGSVRMLQLFVPARYAICWNIGSNAEKRGAVLEHDALQLKEKFPLLLLADSVIKIIITHKLHNFKLLQGIRKDSFMGLKLSQHILLKAW